MATTTETPIPGESLKRYRLSYGGRFLDSFATAKEALFEYESHEKIRPIIDRENTGRYIIRDGKKEITIRELRNAARREEEEKND